MFLFLLFFFQAEDGIRDGHVTGVQTCALPISRSEGPQGSRIKLEEGFLDWYVILDDERSDFAAAKIEKDHGILKGSTPSGERRLAHDVDFAKEKLNKVPKGVEVNLDPL